MANAPCARSARESILGHETLYRADLTPPALGDPDGAPGRIVLMTSGRKRESKDKRESKE